MCGNRQVVLKVLNNCFGEIRCKIRKKTRYDKEKNATEEIFNTFDTISG